MTTDDHNPTFAELFEASLKDGTTTERLEVGQRVKGKLLQIGAEWSFLDVGAKGEAMIATSELLDDDGALTVDEGDTLEGRVVRMGPEGLVVSRVLRGGGAGAKRLLEEAHQTEIPVEGVVKAVIKGGLEVEISGQRTFCPASQISLHYVADLEEFVGQRLTFRVTEYKEGGKNVIVSRKVLLAAEREEQAVDTRAKLAVGAVFSGQVSSIREFGAFVDLGGVDGLLHISEISHRRVDRVEDELFVGQTVEVQVIKLEGDKIALSGKALEGDPWDTAAARFAEGTVHHGLISRVQPFGAFVELGPGVDGLLHVSTLDDPRIKDARRAFEAGQEIDVRVVRLETERRRIGLAPADRAAPAEGGDVSPGTVHTGKVSRIEHYGVFVQLPVSDRDGRPARGLLPREEVTGSPSDLKRAFAVGDEVRVQVIEPDAKGRMRLSQKRLAQAEERAETQKYLAKSQGGSTGSGPGSGLGTLGDLLKKHLDH